MLGNKAKDSVGTGEFYCLSYVELISVNKIKNRNKWNEIDRNNVTSAKPLVNNCDADGEGGNYRDDTFNLCVDSVEGTLYA